ncbi:PREDICTED: serpin A12 [Chinchilla lanigera]|uniref:Serpin family A member 12 n=1 Tax=Chinchilla lanigera TaxID=34839 RepID=A0A8C2VRH2_CHILA|nr:PREDICTED: serpin A12 [Chinchilla lanigera]XP_013372599.1 PREDICTED: serpin A12 [Chinchilla lanigera]
MNLTLGLGLGLGLFLAGLLTTEGQQKPTVFSPISVSKIHPRGWKEERDAQDLARRNMQFGFKLLKKLAISSPRKNVFFSPLSISTAFSLLCLGAQDSTLAEIKQGFNFKGMPERDLHQAFHHLLHKLNQNEEDVKLHFGNTLFMDQKLQPQQKFLRVAKNMYNADILPANFHNLEDTQKQINEYVSRKTHGRIDNLVKNIDSGTVMLLTNYIYFRARWQHEFDPKETKAEDFFVSRNKTVKVPMMFRSGLYDMGYDKQLSCTILEIPYQGNLTATFILPDKGKMRQLQENLQADVFGRWKKLLTKRVVDVHVPRIHISGTYNLKKTLSQLGISKIFEEHGDLTRISPYRSLKVGEAVHKAELKMDEKGTEGAAGSGAETLPMEKPQNVAMNRPYLMMLYETTMPSLLFLGKISNPGGK